MGRVSPTKSTVFHTRAVLSCEGVTMRVHYRGGTVHELVAFERDGRRLQMVGMVGLAAQSIQKHSGVQTMAKPLKAELIGRMGPHAGALCLSDRAASRRTTPRRGLGRRERRRRARVRPPHDPR